MTSTNVSNRTFMRCGSAHTGQQIHRTQSFLPYIIPTCNDCVGKRRTAVTSDYMASITLPVYRISITMYSILITIELMLKLSISVVLTVQAHSEP
jgi:hypothetical protein